MTQKKRERGRGRKRRRRRRATVENLIALLEIVMLNKVDNFHNINCFFLKVSKCYLYEEYELYGPEKTAWHLPTYA